MSPQPGSAACAMPTPCEPTRGSITQRCSSTPLHADGDEDLRRLFWVLRPGTLPEPQSKTEPTVNITSKYSIGWRPLCKGCKLEAFCKPHDHLMPSVCALFHHNFSRYTNRCIKCWSWHLRFSLDSFYMKGMGSEWGTLASSTQTPRKSTRPRTQASQNPVPHVSVPRAKASSRERSRREGPAVTASVSHLCGLWRVNF